MSTFRWSLLTILIGAICLLISLLWPAIPDPRANWTDEKSAALANTDLELHSLSHALIDGMEHAAGDPTHIHTPGEISDPRITALEMERAGQRHAALQAELEAARQIPAGWHLLLGLVGAAMLTLGVAMAIASRSPAEGSE